MISFWEGGVRGTFRVRDDAIIEVAAAVDDQTGRQIPKPDLAQFRTIEQLFTEIGRAIESGAQQLWVTYDPTGLFPARIDIDRWIAFVDDEGRFEATDFVRITPRQTSQ